MAGTDPVTWTELEKHCKDNQSECGRLRNSQGETQTLRIDKALQAMAAEIASFKTFLDARLWVLPRPILYMLLTGAVCAGLAGRAAIELAMKAFGA